MKLLNAFLLAVAFITVGCSASVEPTLVSNKSATPIIGGQLVKQDSALAHSVVGIYDNNFGFTCTGSLLPGNLVLTAAHCIGEKTSEVYVVFHPNMESILNLGKNFRTHPAVRRVVKMKAHEDFAGSQDNMAIPGHDIGLMMYEGETPKNYTPAKILTEPAALKRDALTILAGYGVDYAEVIPVNPRKEKNLQQMINNGEVYCDNDDARKATSCVREEISGPAILKAVQVKIKYTPNEGEVVLDQTGGQAACSGDSGGPAYIQVGNEYQLWGVTSRSGLGCNTDIIYMNILYYAVWITDTAKSFGAK
ncbi:S1 family peptidase [Bdellovibrio sp. HCB288]|uniref:S1 family peptidase n=1 Tax=Bdellovibrio sp. HCB288 TaxID=3394355 RepID=UPI0039B46EA5